MHWHGFDHWPHPYWPPLSEAAFGKLSLERGLGVMFAGMALADLAVVWLTGICL